MWSAERGSGRPGVDSAQVFRRTAPGPGTCRARLCIGGSTTRTGFVLGRASEARFRPSVSVPGYTSDGNAPCGGPGATELVLVVFLEVQAAVKSLAGGGRTARRG